MADVRDSIRIENVVATATLDQKIDLNAVVGGNPGVEYDPKRFPGLVYKLKRPKTSILIFRTGKMVCTGAKSSKEVKRAIKKVVRELKRSGIIIPGKPEIKVVNIVASAVSAFVALIMLLILASLYRTRYILTDEELMLKTTILIGGSKTIPLKTVRSVEKILIPFGIKLFGASFHGGYYHIPGLGRAFLTITNFKDGLLIKTDRRNFVEGSYTNRWR